jgi:hypothetical protein
MDFKLNKKMDSILIEYEKALINLSLSHQKLKSMIADDFIEYGKNGHVYDQKDIFEWLDSNPKRKIKAFNFNLKFLGDNIALLTYISEELDNNNHALQVNRTSIWINRNNQWQMTFHQGTIKNVT